MKKVHPILLSLASVLIWGAFFSWLAFVAISAMWYKDRFFSQIRKIGKAPTYRIGERIDFRNAQNALLVGWSYPEPAFRWSASQRAGFVFRLAPEPVMDNIRFVLNTACTVDKEPVAVRVNDTTVDSRTIVGAGKFAFPIPHGLLRPGATNSVELILPEARLPGNGDPRTLGICLVDAGIDAPRQ